MPVAALGDGVWTGSPDRPVAERRDVPLSRSARAVGALAKGLRRPALYKNLKILEFTERTHMRNWLLTHEQPAVLLGDGDPLVNVSAWAAARYLRELLEGDDARLGELLHYVAGTRRVPIRQLPSYSRHAWQLTLANRLHLTRFPCPDVVILLRISPATSMQRIVARGRELQAHETESFLTHLSTAYERVCRRLESEFGAVVVRLDVDELTAAETAEAVSRAITATVAARRAPRITGPIDPGSVEVIATTMSGSFEDRRKVGDIAAAFRDVTDRPVRVHRADTHGEAEQLARLIVAAGGRTIVSAGGAGTFNAVLEGSLVAGAAPDDLRLAFLRKGSADLIGKVLHVPDDLAGAAAGIANGIETRRDVPADVLEVATAEPDGARRQRHIVGFGGFGVFGEVPRFTESRFIGFYKGMLGTLLGDLGPFFVGLALAAVSWSLRLVTGKVPRVAVTVDGESLPPRRAVSVIVLNGDLGNDFPLGRGLALASGTFRVVILHHRGVRTMARQIAGGRSGKLLDDPDAYAADVRDVRSLEVRPVGSAPRFMVNVDGLRLITRGTVTISVGHRVRLVDAGLPPSRPSAGAETQNVA